MKKYIEPELKNAKFLAEDVIAVSNGTARIIGGDNATGDDVSNSYDGVITFDWSQANWD